MFDQHMLEAEHVFKVGFDRLRMALKLADVHSPRLRRRIQRQEKQDIKLCEKIRRR